VIACVASVFTPSKGVQEVEMTRYTMTLFALPTLLVVGGLRAAPSIGVAPTASSKPAPAAAVASLRIVAISVLAASPTAQGAVKYGVVIENLTSKESGFVQVRLVRPTPSGTAEEVAAVAHVPAFGKTTVDISDPDGLSDGCRAKSFSVYLFGQQADARHRAMVATPTCSFSTKVTDTLSLTTPDRAYEMRSGRASMSSPSVGPYECKKPFTGKLTVFNKTNNPGNKLRVKFSDVGGNELGFADVHVPAGGSTPVEIASIEQNGRLGTMNMTLHDPTHSLGPDKIASQAIEVDVTRHKCTVSAKLTD
jgi:hypothetical protein